VIDFADALRLPADSPGRFSIGRRGLPLPSALHPIASGAPSSSAGYLIQNTVTPAASRCAEAVRRLWYQWAFNTTPVAPVGAEAARALRADVREWSPTWRFSDEMFNLTATSRSTP